jgi:hypothetical protein
MVQWFDECTDDGVVELGCEWVHGEKGNVVFSMASQHDLLMDSLVSDEYEKMVFIDSSGNTVNRKTGEELFGILVGIYAASTTDSLNFTGSHGEYINHE